MAGLQYRPDMDQVRERMTAWWEGGDIGRPAMLISVRREQPWEEVPARPQPEGWITHYSTSDFDYRVNLARRSCVHQDYLGEAVPVSSPCLGPGCVSLYLGCRGVEMKDTVWFEPCIEEPDAFEFRYDRGNFYWDFTLRLVEAQQEAGDGKFMVTFPDLIEGLDTLAALRGTDRLLIDLIERPEWVSDCMRKITDLYFRYYDMVYDLIRDEVGGCHWWIWGPGRTVKMQCDFSAMISPTMFGEFMVPVLEEMCDRISYPFYHWDGPGAIPHHDHLLSIEKLRCLQWVSGAGAKDCSDPEWWPLFHKTIDAGKKVFLGFAGLDRLRALKSEFGADLKQFIIGLSVGSRQEGEEALRTAEV
jgi:hypothetical protein